MGGRTVTTLVALVLAALALLTSACSTTDTTNGAPSATSSAGTVGTSPPPADPPVVAVSTPLVGALVRSIAGDQVDIEVLLPTGVDPIDPAGSTPGIVVDDADLVVVVDPATYELGLADLVDAADDQAIPVVALAPQLGAIGIGRTAAERVAPAAAATDPHVWLDTDRWTQAGRLVADAVVELDGVSATEVATAVEAFDDALGRTDEEIQALTAAMPPEARTVVSDTHALAYLADRYGIDLVLPVDFGALVPTAVERGTGRLLTSMDDPAQLDELAAEAAPPITVVRVDVDGSGLSVGPDAGGATAAYTGLLLAVVGAMAGAPG